MIVSVIGHSGFGGWASTTHPPKGFSRIICRAWAESSRAREHWQMKDFLLPARVPVGNNAFAITAKRFSRSYPADIRLGSSRMCSWRCSRKRSRPGLINRVLRQTCGAGMLLLEIMSVERVARTFASETCCGRRWMKVHQAGREWAQRAPALPMQTVSTMLVEFGRVTLPRSLVFCLHRGVP